MRGSILPGDYFRREYRRFRTFTFDLNRVPAIYPLRQRLGVISLSRKGDNLDSGSGPEWEEKETGLWAKPGISEKEDLRKSLSCDFDARQRLSSYNRMN